MVVFADLLGAAPPDVASLVAALRRGGLVLVMRHANAPAKPPAKGAADAENTGHERQLDAAGRTAATDMGAAFRRLGIPVGQVWSSPTYRTRETVRLAGFAAPVIVAELDGASAQVRLAMTG